MNDETIVKEIYNRKSLRKYYRINDTHDTGTFFIAHYYYIKKNRRDFKMIGKKRIYGALFLKCPNPKIRYVQSGSNKQRVVLLDGDFTRKYFPVL